MSRSFFLRATSRTSWCLAAALHASACAELPNEPAGPTPELDEIASAVLSPVNLAPGATFTPNTTQYYTFGTNGLSAQCRDGSAAGVTVKYTGSDKLMVYLKGGGGCFDTFSCGLSDAFLSPTNITSDNRELQTKGIFDFSKPNNPIAGWNIVYLPYCTGDLHLGTQIGSVPNGPQNQKFYGRKNLNVFLQSVVATFKNSVSTVLVAGESAGGAGTGGSAIPVQNAFTAAGKNPIVRVLDDSGPFLSAGSTFDTDYFPTCAQALWRNIWGLDQSIIADCGLACRDGAGNVLPNFIPAFAGVVTQRFTSQGRKPALLISYNDAGLGIMFGDAKNQCRAFGNINYSMGNALSDLRTRFGSNLRTYFVNSIQHTYINQDSYWTTTQNGVSLNTWVTGHINGTAVADQVGP